MCFELGVCRARGRIRTDDLPITSRMRYHNATRAGADDGAGAKPECTEGGAWRARGNGSAADGQTPDRDRRATKGGLDGEEGGLQGELGGGADGEAAVGLLQGAGGANGGCRVDAGGEPLGGGRLVGVDQRRGGGLRLGAEGAEQGDVAVGAEEVGERLADGVEAGAAELPAVADLEPLAQRAG